jgi:lipoic acid synthetase
MLYINTTKNTTNTCGFYFGLEEYLIKDYDTNQDIFMLWTVEPTVMIGRHQVTTIEVDQEYITNNNINIVRRNSGGGAVYTDPGCFQFSFITSKQAHDDIFTSHVHHIIDAINKLGIPATFTGRNDIVVDGQKFSGNAEYIYKDRMVIHGTILFDTNMDHLVGSLTPDKSKLTKHAIQSVKSRVLNLSSLIDMDIEAFREYLVEEIKTSEITLESLDLKTIKQYEKKFYTQAWNYGKNPSFEYKYTEKLDSGLYTVYVKTKKNLVESMRITGDFFSVGEIAEFEAAFVGMPFTRDGFVKVTKYHKVRDFFYRLKRREFLKFFFEEPKQKKRQKPDYLKIDMHNLNEQNKEIRTLLDQHNLHTVCQEASCPNQMECFSNKTATFMILGVNCTRKCAFCDVATGKPDQIDPEEPKNILRAAKLMGLKHVVVTSVARDDLKDDYGSKHFVDVIETMKEGRPETTIEVLIPDFQGHKESIKRVVDAKPDVINHNMETVRRISPVIRHRAKYDQSLELLRYVKELDPTMLTKSGIMVGVGETEEEVIDLMKDLRSVGCDIITIGQYLQPSKDHFDVVEYVSMEQFDRYKAIGQELGFRFVASGPMVRSSYQAHKQFKGEQG